MAASLADQLQPLAQRLAAAQTVSVPVLQVGAALPRRDAAAAQACAAVRDWLAGKIDARLPPEAARHVSFDLRPDADLEVVTSPAPWVWAARFGEPDRSVPGRAWGVEVAIYRGEEPRFALRLTCTAPISGDAADSGDFIPAVPAFVHRIAATIGLSSAGHALEAEAVPVASAEDVSDLVALIEAQERRVPVVVASTLEHLGEPSPPFDADALAQAMAGLCHVFVVSFAAARLLTERMGKEWSVFHGGCRLYLPGLDRARQSPRQHRLILGKDLQTAEARTESLARLRRLIARSSIEQPNARQDFPPFRELRARLAQIAADQGLQAATGPADRRTLLEAKIRSLEQQVESALEVATQEEEKVLRIRAEMEQLREDLDEVKRHNFLLRERIAALERRNGPGFAERQQALRPDSYQELGEWAERCFPDRLVLSAKARRAVAGSAFRDIGLVCDALELLATAYVDMRREGKGRDAYEAGLRRLYLDDDQIAASPDHHRNDPQYICRYEGDEFFTGRHLKKGTSYDPRECLRIYYAWDEDGRRVMIGHLTTHLTTAVS